MRLEAVRMALSLGTNATARVTALAAALLMSAVAACDRAHVADDGGADAFVADATCRSAPVLPAVACAGLVALRGSPVVGHDFVPLGPVGDTYLFPFADPLPAGTSAMMRISLDLATTDTSHPLEGFPRDLGGQSTILTGADVDPSTGIVAAVVGATTSFDTWIALFDAEGRSLAEPVAIGPTVDRVVRVTCDGVQVLAFTAATDGSCGSTMRALTLGLDGAMRADSGPVPLAEAPTAAASWDADHWTLAVSPVSASCAYEGAPFTSTIAPSGTVGARHTLAVGADDFHHGYLFVVDPGGPWSALGLDDAHGFTYARFDPASGSVSVSTTVSSPPRGDLRVTHAAREAGGTDGFLFLEHAADGDTPTVLLRIAADGSLLQQSTLENTNFTPRLFRWLGDRYAVRLLAGTDVLGCMR
jgi:hypothetical protein